MRMANRSGSDLAWMRAGLFWGYRAIGRPGRAAEFFDADGDHPNLLAARATDAFYSGDHEAVISLLAEGWPERSNYVKMLQEPRRIALLGRVGAVADVERLHRDLVDDEAFFARGDLSPGGRVTMPVLEAEVALADGRVAEAVELFESQLREDWQFRGPLYFTAVVDLARAYEPAGPGR